MNKAPGIGQRVRYVGGHADRDSVTGTVEKISITRTYRDDIDWDDPDLTDADVKRAETGDAPQSEWKAHVRVDELPAWWPYGDCDIFCPDVSCLQPIE